MRSTLDELRRELHEVRALVASIDAVHKALSAHDDQATRTYPLVRRRFDYAALIVALYASFEKFAEDLVLSYARLVTQLSPYAELPDSLKRKHLIESVDLLARGRLGEGRYQGVTAVDVVRNLFQCLSGHGSYSLNEDAIVAHELNLRCSELGALFSAVGIENIGDRVRRADDLVKWYREQDGNTAQEIPEATVRTRLDDLVERRNRVTHRGGAPGELMGLDQMKDLINFAEALAASVFALTVSSYLAKKYSNSTIVERLNLKEGPLGAGRNIVVVTKPAKRLYVGQPAFAFFDGAGVRWGRIRGLQLNDVPTLAVDQDSVATEVGVEVDFRCAKRVVLSVLEVEDDIVWSPEVLPAPPVTIPGNTAPWADASRPEHPKETQNTSRQHEDEEDVQSDGRAR